MNRHQNAPINQTIAGSKTQQLSEISVALVNRNDLTYLGPLYFGTNRAFGNVIYDTGSGWVTITSNQCSNCDSHVYTTTGQLGPEKDLYYGSVTLKGSVVQDKVCIQDDLYCLSDFEFYAITSQTGLNGVDGILGLSPDVNSNGPSYV